MSRELHDRVGDLFSRARRLPVDEQAAFLDKHCGDDPDLRAEVESLLEEDTDGSLETTLVQHELGQAAAESIGASGSHPESIAHYRIIRLIGEGGMGTVYEAEQDDPRRRVALKVVRPGVFDQRHLTRFRYEAQVLGQLRHPGIAQIYEAGTADRRDGGQPYFAMELVNGKPLPAYAEAQKLDAPQRLELIARICDALQHAHQQGVIHRDLKPANILVEADGQPKILDFGVARASDSDIQAVTVHTEIGQLVGTVPYMSPEQASGDPAALDTRSDIYGLGVISYELLAGRLPYQLRDKTIHEAVRTIQEEEPSRLSAVDRTYRGDVETIVAKALEKDKERRYQSAAELAADIRRYLHDEPIVARPASTLYQLRKFTRRNRTLVGAAVVVASALVIATVLSTASAIGESRARKAADESARIATAVNEFLTQDILKQANPNFEPNREITLREVLERASEAIEGRFADDPLTEAAIRMTLQRTFRELSEYDSAEEHITRAVEIRRTELGEEHPDTIRALLNLATIFGRQGRLEDATEQFEQLLELARRVLGQDHDITETALNELARNYDDLGRHEEAVKMFQELRETQRRVLDEDDPEYLITLNNLAGAYWEMNRLDDAEPLYIEVLERRRKVLGNESPFTMNSIGNLASVYLNRREPDAAEPLYLEKLKLSRRVLGENHRDTYETMGALGIVYYHQEKFEEAEEMALAQVTGFREILELGHWQLGNSLVTHGAILTRLERFDDAEASLKESYAILDAALGSGHWRVENVIEKLAKLYDAWDKPEQAGDWRAKLSAD